MKNNCRRPGPTRSSANYARTEALQHLAKVFIHGVKLRWWSFSSVVQERRHHAWSSSRIRFCAAGAWNSSGGWQLRSRVGRNRRDLARLLLQRRGLLAVFNQQTNRTRTVCRSSSNPRSCCTHQSTWRSLWSIFAPLLTFFLGYGAEAACLIPRRSAGFCPTVSI